MNKRISTVVLGAFLLTQTISAVGAQDQNTVDGSNVGSFFSSGAQVNPMDMERASMAADSFVNLPPGHNIKLPKPGKKLKKKGLASGVGRAFAHTANFVGFPVGDDHDVDASLSSDLQNEENKIKIKQIEAAQNAQAAEAKAAKDSK